MIENIEATTCYSGF